MKFIEFSTKVSKPTKFRVFREDSPNVGHFLKIYLIRNTIGSRLKRVATGSVSKKYQTSLSAQFSKTFLENVSFDIVCTNFHSQ